MPAFHYAFKIKDIQSTRDFYVDILGCKEGRSTEQWIDFDFFGHQLSAHISTNIPDLDYCGLVDAVSVPIPHFGCLLNQEQFKTVEEKLKAANINFIVAPQVRYEGKPSQQLTMFVLDFSNNALEFKAFKDEGEVFV